MLYFSPSLWFLWQYSSLENLVDFSNLFASNQLCVLVTMPKVCSEAYPQAWFMVLLPGPMTLSIYCPRSSSGLHRRTSPLTWSLLRAMSCPIWLLNCASFGSNFSNFSTPRVSDIVSFLFENKPILFLISSTFCRLLLTFCFPTLFPRASLLSFIRRQCYQRFCHCAT